MASKSALSLDMLIRCMPYSSQKIICDMMDVGSDKNNWEALAGSIKDPKTKENRYSLLDIQHFGLELKRDKSMTRAVLTNWGTQETTVQQLFEVLVEIGRKDVITEIMPDYNQKTQKQLVKQNPHHLLGEPQVGRNKIHTTSIEAGLKEMTISGDTQSPLSMVTTATVKAEKIQTMDTKQEQLETQNLRKKSTWQGHCATYSMSI
ncbi:uncharacterized protein [Antedon mediterranea]|uniref:uncharacterized protein n=1 Tax=Antedon mediterranea TaxID=105859 RepID=UPI003AF8EE4F